MSSILTETNRCTDTHKSVKVWFGIQLDWHNKLQAIYNKLRLLSSTRDLLNMSLSENHKDVNELFRENQKRFSTVNSKLCY